MAAVVLVVVIEVHRRGDTETMRYRDTHTQRHTETQRYLAKLVTIAVANAYDHMSGCLARAYALAIVYMCHEGMLLGHMSWQRSSSGRSGGSCHDFVHIPYIA